MKNKPSINQDKNFKYSINTFISTFVTAYFIVSAIKLLFHINDEIFYTSLEFLQKESSPGDLILHLLFIACVAGILTLLEYVFPSAKITSHAMLISAFCLALILMYNVTESQNYTYLAVVFALALVILYATKQGCFSFIKADIKPAVMWGAVGIFTLIFGFFIVGIGVLRHLTYSTPNFDFGIFCNMFYNMSESGLPTVSCERDQILSHFAVHFSPIYYVFLPIYFIFPYAVTLQILQVLVIYSGIIPLVLIARKKGISTKVTIILSVIYSAFPALGGGTFYDLHENCFLVPLLLWVFYFYESKKYIPMAVFGVLTLLVKEDAFIYLLFFALYVLIADKNWKVSLPVAAVAIVYFVTVSSIMEAHGTGIMSNRYGNLIYDSEDGLLGVIKTFIMNPGYVLTQIFSSPKGNAEKIWYLLHLLLPLGFIPFATKKLSRYLLLCPILLNILTMYQYQPDITFQYSFGITAFLFYATVLNLSELEGFSKKYLLQVAAAASVLLFVMVCVPKFASYAEKHDNFSDTYDRFDYALTEVLPEDVPVAASSFFISHIYDRDEIYEVKYHKDDKGNYKTDIEYIALDMRYKDDSNAAAVFYLANGYEEFYLDEGYVLILKKAS